jgi:hypothetical protein
MLALRNSYPIARAGQPNLSARVREKHSPRWQGDRLSNESLVDGVFFIGKSPRAKGETAMADLLSKLNTGELIGLVAVVGALLIPLLCGLTSIIADHFYKLRQLALIRDMLNRGMSGDEIRAVLEASSKPSPKTQDRQDSRPA